MPLVGLAMPGLSGLIGGLSAPVPPTRRRAAARLERQSRSSLGPVRSDPHRSGFKSHSLATLRRSFHFKNDGRSVCTRRVQTEDSRRLY